MCFWHQNFETDLLNPFWLNTKKWMFNDQNSNLVHEIQQAPRSGQSHYQLILRQTRFTFIQKSIQQHLCKEKGLQSHLFSYLKWSMKMIKWPCFSKDLFYPWQQAFLLLSLKSCLKVLLELHLSNQIKFPR